jgi:peptidoglycan-associated lipoprotein
MHKYSQIWVVAACGAMLLAGCSSHKPKPTAASTTGTSVPSDQSQTAGADTSGAYGSALANGSGAGVEGPTAGQLKNRIIYFDFDSSEIRGDYTSLIAAHAKYLASNASIRVRIEGNTDERGSREYNIGLGERRAQAVRRALLLQGVAESQITTVSYGEERPAVTGHTEDAWSRNRRAEIVYLN